MTVRGLTPLCWSLAAKALSVVLACTPTFVTLAWTPPWSRALGRHGQANRNLTDPFDLGVKSNGDTAGFGVRSYGALMTINSETTSFAHPHNTPNKSFRVWFCTLYSSLLPVFFLLNNSLFLHSLLQDLHCSLMDIYEKVVHLPYALIA
ncbi:hypothetical protein JHK86_001339 [Glycine max]|nr:hypothetical protein JHK86_001339 [Glycine max]